MDLKDTKLTWLRPPIPNNHWFVGALEHAYDEPPSNKTNNTVLAIAVFLHLTYDPHEWKVVLVQHKRDGND